MKVNKSSWHYRLNDWDHRRRMGRWAPPASLCAYFWHTVGTLLKLAPIFAMFPLAILAILAVIADAIIVAIRTGAWPIILGVLLACALVLGVAILRERRRNRLRAHPKPPRGPGLLVSYLKAAKSRVCPLIEYID